MRRIKLIKKKIRLRRVALLTFILFFSFIIFLNLSTRTSNIPRDKVRENTNHNVLLPKISAFNGTLNITDDYKVNNSRFAHGTNITVTGEVWHLIHGPLVNVNVSVVMDDVLYPQFCNKTNFQGKFIIENITIPNNLDIFSAHTLQVNVTDDRKVQYISQIIFYTKTTSYFDIDTVNSDRADAPKIIGEDFHVQGYLRYADGTGVSLATVHEFYYNSTSSWAEETTTTSLPGFFSDDLQVPNTPSDNVSIKLYFNTIANQVNYSEYFFENITVCPNVTISWSTVATATEGDRVTITGQVVSSADSSVGISYRQVIIRDTTAGGRTIIHQTNIYTNANGVFSFTYTIPDGVTTRSFEVELDTTLPTKPTSTTTITILEGSSSEKSIEEDEDSPPPFQTFALIITPIISVVVGLLVFLGYKFYKKQAEEAMVINVPLENKIKNLKILKDTERIEEALSYLFTSIYGDLIEAKFGRKRDFSETIRDFAIVSVRDLKLSPTSIYPFIQKIEQIIYARPFAITERDFYNTVELFSPIYYELTGYNFVLNF